MLRKPTMPPDARTAPSATESHWMDQPAAGPWNEFRRVLGRHWRIPVAGALAGVLAGWLAFSLQTPEYQARATIEIQDPADGFLNLKQLSPALDSSGPVTASDIQTQVRILQSSSLIQAALRRLSPAPAGGVSREEEAEGARRRLQVRDDRQARIVEILFDARDPSYAAGFANALAQEYVRQDAANRSRAGREAAEYLDTQLREARIRLRSSDDALQAYAARTGLVFTSERQSLSEEKLRQLQDGLSRAQTEAAEKQSRHEIAEATPVEALPDVLADNSLRDYQAKLTDLRRQKAESSVHFTPEFPKIRQLEAQIATLEAAGARTREAILKRIGTEHQDARRRESLLREIYDRQAQQVRQDAERSVQYNILKREVETHRQIYDGLLQRHREASIAATVRTTGVRIVDPAAPPPRPYKPSLALHLMAGLLGGLSLGAALVILLESGDRTIQLPGDSAAWLSSPELGFVPTTGRENSGRRGGIRVRVVLGAKSGARAAAKSKPEPVELAAWQPGTSRTATSFRAVRTSILFSGGNGACPRILAITSASAAEGKTTVAANLAVALAGIRRRVLLIDADIRKPRLHQVFGLSNAYGLTDLLGGDLGASAEGLKYVVQQTPVPGLAVLTSGPECADATDLLNSGFLPGVLHQALESYDVVLLDTPPVLELPDARIVGRMAEAVVLVIRAGRTTRGAALAVKRQLQADGIQLLGTVLNDLEPGKVRAAYYGSHGR